MNNCKICRSTIYVRSFGDLDEKPIFCPICIRKLNYLMMDTPSAYIEKKMTFSESDIINYSEWLQGQEYEYLENNAGKLLQDWMKQRPAEKKPFEDMNEIERTMAWEKLKKEAGIISEVPEMIHDMHNGEDTLYLGTFNGTHIIRNKNDKPLKVYWAFGSEYILMPGNQLSRLVDGTKKVESIPGWIPKKSFREKSEDAFEEERSIKTFEKETTSKPPFKVGDWVWIPALGGAYLINSLKFYTPLEKDYQISFNLSELYSITRLATDSEIESSLIAEAKRRGYKEGSKIKWIEGKLQILKTNNGKDFTFLNYNLYYGLDMVWKAEGNQWAEIVEDEAVKPPLGIIPEFIHNEKRLNALGDAIMRYEEAKLKVPSEWRTEFNILLEKVNGRKK